MEPNLHTGPACGLQNVGVPVFSFTHITTFLNVYDCDYQDSYESIFLLTFIL